MNDFFGNPNGNESLVDNQALLHLLKPPLAINVPPNAPPGSTLRGFTTATIIAVDSANNPKYATIGVQNHVPFESGYLIPPGSGPFAAGGTSGFHFFYNNSSGVGGSIVQVNLDTREIVSFTGDVSSSAPTPYYKAITDHVHSGSLNPDGYTNPQPVDLSASQTQNPLPYTQNSAAVQSVINSSGQLLSTQFSGAVQNMDNSISLASNGPSATVTTFQTGTGTTINVKVVMAAASTGAAFYVGDLAGNNLYGMSFDAAGISLYRHKAGASGYLISIAKTLDTSYHTYKLTITIGASSTTVEGTFDSTPLPPYIDSSPATLPSPAPVVVVFSGTGTGKIQDLEVELGNLQVSQFPSPPSVPAWTISANTVGTYVTGPSCYGCTVNFTTAISPDPGQWVDHAEIHAVPPGTWSSTNCPGIITAKIPKNQLFLASTAYSIITNQNLPAGQAYELHLVLYDHVGKCYDGGAAALQTTTAQGLNPANTIPSLGKTNFVADSGFLHGFSYWKNAGLPLTIVPISGGQVVAESSGANTNVTGALYSQPFTPVANQQYCISAGMGWTDVGGGGTMYIGIVDVSDYNALSGAGNTTPATIYVQRAIPVAAGTYISNQTAPVTYTFGASPPALVCFCWWMTSANYGFSMYDPQIEPGSAFTGYVDGGLTTNTAGGGTLAHGSNSSSVRGVISLTGAVNVNPPGGVTNNLPYNNSATALTGAIDSSSNIKTTEFPGQLLRMNGGTYAGYSQAQTNLVYEPATQNIVNSAGKILWQQWTFLNSNGTTYSTNARGPIFVDGTTVSSNYYYLNVGNGTSFALYCNKSGVSSILATWTAPTSSATAAVQTVKLGIYYTAAGNTVTIVGWWNGIRLGSFTDTSPAINASVRCGLSLNTPTNNYVRSFDFWFDSQNLDDISDGGTYGSLPLVNVAGSGTGKRALIDLSQSHINTLPLAKNDAVIQNRVQLRWDVGGQMPYVTASNILTFPSNVYCWRADGSYCFIPATTGLALPTGNGLNAYGGVFIQYSTNNPGTLLYVATNATGAAGTGYTATMNSSAYELVGSVSANGIPSVFSPLFDNSSIASASADAITDNRNGTGTLNIDTKVGAKILPRVNHHEDFTSTITSGGGLADSSQIFKNGIYNSTAYLTDIVLHIDTSSGTGLSFWIDNGTADTNVTIYRPNVTTLSVGYYGDPGTSIYAGAMTTTTSDTIYAIASYKPGSTAGVARIYAANVQQSSSATGNGWTIYFQKTTNFSVALASALFADSYAVQFTSAGGNTFKGGTVPGSNFKSGGGINKIF